MWWTRNLKLRVCVPLQEQSRYETTENQSQNQFYRLHQSIGWIASMIQETETEFGRIVIIASNVQLFYRIVEHIVSQTNIFRCLTTSLIMIGRYVRAERSERTEAISCYRNRSWTKIANIWKWRTVKLISVGSRFSLTPFPFSHLHAYVVVFGTRVTQKSDASPVKFVSATRRCWCTSITPDRRTLMEKYTNNVLSIKSYAVVLHSFMDLTFF